VRGTGEVAISARGVSKKFVSYHSRATSLKELALRRKHSSEDFWALRDVSIEVDHGETVGLIGANGSGKSTLLKVLAGILKPTTGQVQVGGRIASLLELGAGFNGELSGRDNVYLNGSLLGLSRRDVDSVFDDIVEFSELGDFIDNSVKHYSSGMYVRLGFAVAVNVDPDILLVDEVLAVGDEHFQEKCLRKIEEFQTQGRTILFVTHGLELVERICNRALVLDHGQLVCDGVPIYATGVLRGLLGMGAVDVPTTTSPSLEFVDVTVSHEPGGVAVETFRPGEPFVLRLVLDVVDPELVPAGKLWVTILGAGDIPICLMELPADQMGRLERGKVAIDFSTPSMPPLNGTFGAAVGIYDVENKAVAGHRFPLSFTVKGPQPAGIFDVPFAHKTTPLG